MAEAMVGSEETSSTSPDKVTGQPYCRPPTVSDGASAGRSRRTEGIDDLGAVCMSVLGDDPTQSTCCWECAAGTIWAMSSSAWLPRAARERSVVAGEVLGPWKRAGARPCCCCTEASPTATAGLLFHPMASMKIAA